MVDIYNTMLLDLLPPNLKQDPDMIAASKSIDNDFLEVVNEAKTCILLPNIDNLDSDVIDVLAWQQHVDFYDISLDLDKRKTLVKNSIPWHKRKGTPSVVEEFISTFYKNSKIEEWFEYGGNPYYFRILLDYKLDDEIKSTNIQKKWSTKNFYLNGSWVLDGSLTLNGCESYSETGPQKVSSNPLLQNNLISGLELVKNKRSWLDEIILYLSGSFDEKETFDNTIVRNKFFMPVNNDITVVSTNKFSLKESEDIAGKVLIDKLWLLDGTYNLDGTKLLDGEILEVAI